MECSECSLVMNRTQILCVLTATNKAAIADNDYHHHYYYHHHDICLKSKIGLVRVKNKRPAEQWSSKIPNPLSGHTIVLGGIFDFIIGHLSIILTKLPIEKSISLITISVTSLRYRSISLHSNAMI